MTARVREVSWVLQHMEDLDADFLRYYRTEWPTLAGPRFLSLAQRVWHYGGVMAAVVQDFLQPEEPEGEDTLPPLPDGAVVVPESAWAGLKR